jgi:hypothetical protein
MPRRTACLCPGRLQTPSRLRLWHESTRPIRGGPGLSLTTRSVGARAGCLHEAGARSRRVGVPGLVPNGHSDAANGDVGCCNSRKAGTLRPREPLIALSSS